MGFASPLLAMGKKAKGGGAGGKAKQSSLLGGGFDFAAYPQLKKPMEAIAGI